MKLNINVSRKNEDDYVWKALNQNQDITFWTKTGKFENFKVQKGEKVNVCKLAKSLSMICGRN